MNSLGRMGRESRGHPERRRSETVRMQMACHVRGFRGHSVTSHTHPGKHAREPSPSNLIALALGQIAPGVGQIAPGGWGKSLHPTVGGAKCSIGCITCHGKGTRGLSAGPLARLLGIAAELERER